MADHNIAHNDATAWATGDWRAAPSVKAVNLARCYLEREAMLSELVEKWRTKATRRRRPAPLRDLADAMNDCEGLGSEIDEVVAEMYEGCAEELAARLSAGTKE